ncbi:uncharacterized protein [Macrobrachium rosenbergii]|uniref:uncharacterized protein n=1 Tax=Macrobrachium rosenbergii TaxID=79674 RepID=UPI0034D79AD4
MDIFTFKSRSLLVPPSTKPYNLKILETSKPSNVNYNSYLKSSVGFPPLHRVVMQIFEARPPGFFVEAGALDGEWLSNTLYLEKDKGWQGLLVEPDRKMFAHLLQKNRRAWSANCCLSVKDYPVKEALVSISNPKGSGDDVGYRAMNTLLSSGYPSALSGYARVTFDQVQCVPLKSLLKALDVDHVDFVSLDVEGSKILLRPLLLLMITVFSFVVIVDFSFYLSSKDLLMKMLFLYA